jgi:hypothetical protein
MVYAGSDQLTACTVMATTSTYLCDTLVGLEVYYHGTNI